MALNCFTFNVYCLYNSLVDEVVEHESDILLNDFAKEVIVARSGGDELVLVLPKANEVINAFNNQKNPTSISDGIVTTYKKVDID